MLRLRRLLENIGTDFFLSDFYPAGDVKSYHLKYWLIFIVNLYLKIYHRIEVVNPQKIPLSGGAVIASNHTSHLDGIIINAITAFHTRRKINFLAAEDVYNQKPVQDIIVEVLNGCGVPSLASKTTGFLRSKQFDVVKSGNANHQDYQYTLMIQRNEKFESHQKNQKEIGDN